MSAIQWLTAVGSLAGVVLGGTGLGVIIRARAQNRRDHDEGSAVARAAHTDEWDRLVQRIYDTQVRPLEERMAGLEQKVIRMDEEIQTWRSRYWSAIEHVRRLTLWITRHMPDGIPAPPVPPATIADDL